MNDVADFLKRFHTSDNINEVFQNGCCYWFAYILFTRFLKSGAIIMYDEVANHFGTKIGDNMVKTDELSSGDRVYDVTGDVTDKYSWIGWLGFDDENHRQRIIKDCIMF